MYIGMSIMYVHRNTHTDMHMYMYNVHKIHCTDCAHYLCDTLCTLFDHVLSGLVLLPHVPDAWPHICAEECDVKCSSKSERSTGHE